VLLLVVSEDALEAHGQLDALARLGAAIDQVPEKDDPVALGHGEASRSSTASS